MLVETLFVACVGTIVTVMMEAAFKHHFEPDPNAVARRIAQGHINDEALNGEPVIVDMIPPEPQAQPQPQRMSAADAPPAAEGVAGVLPVENPAAEGVPLSELSQPLLMPAPSAPASEQSAASHMNEEESSWHN